MRMKRRGFGWAVLRPLILGGVLGALGTTLCFYPQGLSIRNLRREFTQADVAEQADWPPAEFQLPCDWAYLKVDESGWSTGPVGTFYDLGNRLIDGTEPTSEIVIPVLPSVYTPNMIDKNYYDAILRSDIEQGDKVLVIGTGTGADAWAAFLKSKDVVYVVEINPMAVVNARATARLGGFQIKPIVGDITDVELPHDFRDFDYVLWNMPCLAMGTTTSMETYEFHDGDDGTILRRFLELLPSLLKNDGKAIVWNPGAKEFITSAGLTAVTKDDSVYVVSLPSSAVTAE